MAREVKIAKVDWDEACEISFIVGYGFEITEPAFTKKSETKNLKGIQSPIYASDWDDEDAFSDRYSCKCKDLQSRVHEGETCPLCGTKVEFVDVDLKTVGWIKLGGYSIIQPNIYRMLKSIIGNKVFAEIIEYDKDVNRDGQSSAKKGKNPFKGIGLVEFKDRFEEIMDYYKDRKKQKLDLIEEVMSQKSTIFASAIPVYSSVLRPVMFKGESFRFNSFDKKFESIFALSRLLMDESQLNSRQKRKKEDFGEATTLGVIQKKVNELWTLVFDQINQKDGHIRYHVLGGRLGYSARNVIIPDPSLKADEIRIGYLTFLELYKWEIIAHLSKMANIPHSQAYEDWYKATITFDPKVYNVMMYLVKKRKARMIINRNPTINYGSMIQMRVVDIKMNYDDYTMSIPIHVLSILNADFDGDVLNIFSLKTKKLAKAFSAFNPRYNMFVSRNDGLFNNEFNLLKDQMIGLYEFCNI